MLDRKGMPVPGPLKSGWVGPADEPPGPAANDTVIVWTSGPPPETGISHQHIRADGGPCDPLNSLSAPPTVFTAGTGLDVPHARGAESFTAQSSRSTSAGTERPIPAAPVIGANPIADLWRRRRIRVGGRIFWPGGRTTTARTWRRRPYGNGGLPTFAGTRVPATPGWHIPPRRWRTDPGM